MIGADALTRLKELQGDIQTINADIQSRYNTIPSAASLTTAAGSGGGLSDVTGNTAVKIAGISAARDKLLSEWIDLFEAVLMVLDRMTDRKAAQVLHVRYVLDYQWQQINEYMVLGDKQCYRLHKAGLEEFSRLWADCCPSGKVL